MAIELVRREHLTLIRDEMEFHAFLVQQQAGQDKAPKLADDGRVELTDQQRERALDWIRKGFEK
jgi:hypothetical protein